MNLLTKCFPYGNAALKYPNRVLYPFHFRVNFSSPKCFSTLNDLSNLKIPNAKELEIPMPYGKLAAKAWGSETGYPVLAFHGWLDNCGTFDKLLPLLNNKFYIVAIDAPGHGLSSHKPPGCLYTDIDNILDYRKVIDYLGWKKFHLMGHSLGAAIALLFSSLFPDYVQKIIAIDQAKPMSEHQANFPSVISNALAELLKLEKKLSKSPPIYPREAVISRLVKGMHNEITEEGAEILLKRGSRISECGTGVVFSRDLRCQPIEYISMRSHELTYQLMSAVKSELMLIMANGTHPKFQSDKPEILEKVVEVYKKNSKNFVLKYVEGNHFVHLNNPERLAPLINNFLTG